MPWRKWFIRGLVFSIIAGCVGVALIYQRWTDPAIVREMVIAKLQDMYPGAVITVDSARLRILGGIQVNELRMSRRDDPDRTEFFHVPSAIIYHDKEKISQGQLTLRKVELNRARLRIVRRRDGTLNLQEIISDRPPEMVLPTVVWHHGTIVLEDQQSSQLSTPIEINDVNLGFINDPISIVSLTGTASSSVLGAVELEGHIQRDTKDIALKIKSKGTVVGPTLTQYLVDCPKLADLSVQARVDVEASLSYRPKQKEPLDYSVTLKVTEGKLRHPRLPLPLDGVRTTIECSNGAVHIDNFEAHSGPTLLKGWARTQLPCPDQTFEGELEAQHLIVSSDLAERVGEKIHLLQQLFDASGSTTLRIACARRDGRWVNLSSGAETCFTLLPEAGQVCFKYFKYPLTKIGQPGYIEWRPASMTTRVDVVGYVEDRPVKVFGHWTGSGDQVDSSFEIFGDDIPVLTGIINALPDRLRKLTHSFHPTGRFNVKANLTRQPGSTEYRHEYHIYLRDGTVCWDEFPCHLQKVSGFLDIYPGNWVFHTGRAQHRNGEVQVEGNSLPGDKGRGEDDGLELKITGRAIGLDDEDMRRAAASMPHLAKPWESLRPSGRINFGAYVKLPPGRPQNVDVRVDVNGAAIEPQFFPFLIHGLKGQFHFHDNRLELSGIQARHNDATLVMNTGTVDVLPGGGHYTKFANLRIERLRANDALLRALPKTLRSFTSSLQLDRPVDISTALIIRQDAEAGSGPDIYWNGEMALHDTQFSTGVTFTKVDGVVACRGRHDGRALLGLKGNVLFDNASLFKQVFKRVHADFEVKEKSPDMLNIHLHAPIFGGDVTGMAHVDLTSEMGYRLKLDFSNIDIQQAAAANLGQRPSQLEGKLEGQLYLEGLGTSADTLAGDGRFDVNHGRIMNLPLLLDLLKFLGLRLPDRTAFEDLHALFSIRGSRASVRRLNLTGNAISLTGKGEFNLDGTDLNLDFYPSWGHIEQSWFKDISKLISKNILIIEMRGKVDANPDHLRFNKRFVPLISDPLRDLRQKMAD